jgi:two-component system, chemotaxis family, protein-glutamate methylesterase/glutaminase
MVVDDSAVIRGLVSRWVEAERDLELVGVAVNGRDGVEKAAKLLPHVVVLDIEMPVMDGIAALPQILKAAPGCRVVMASTLTQRGAEVTIKALSLGAADYVAKPDASKLAAAADYKRDLFAKIRALGARAARLAAATTPSAPAQAMGSSAAVRPLAARSQGSGPALSARAAGVTLRPALLKARPDAVFIGSSTGGPEALKHVIEALAGKVQVPVFITQHMPAMFTRMLAEHLCKQTGASVVEASEGMMARPGVFHIAPGDWHMGLTRSAGVVRIALSQAPPENFCRPAVDPMFRAAAELYGDRALAVILTGMGHDGREGARVLTGKGALLIAQDEASSVVWGMPGAVAEAGLCSAIKPVGAIGPAILDVLRGVAP